MLSVNDVMVELTREKDSAVKLFGERVVSKRCTVVEAFKYLKARMGRIQDRINTFEETLLNMATLEMISEEERYRLFDMAQSLYDECEEIRNSH